MAFDLNEVSASSGRPIVLYEFYRLSGGMDFYWRYNTSDRDITYLGQIYSASVISDRGITQDIEPAASEFVVTMPVTESFIQMYRMAGVTPSDTVYLTVFRHHYGDTDAAVMWKGTVSGITQINEIQADLSCSVLVASFRRGGLRLSYTRGCPLSLYGIECKANPESFKVDATVDAIDGNSITSINFLSRPNGWLDGGFLTWVTDMGLTERRGIKAHTGDLVILSGLSFGMGVGDVVSAYAGCRRTRQVCDAKFGNILNYGGTMMYSPGRNPFDGNPVF